MVRTIRRRCPLVLFVMLLVLAGAGAARAQSPGANAPVDHQQILSVNPLTSMFKIFNAEYERKLMPATTWGAEGSFLNIGGFDYRSANVLVRFYPQRAALTGFFIGGRAGVHHVAVDVDHSIDAPSANFFGAGIDIGIAGCLARSATSA